MMNKLAYRTAWRGLIPGMEAVTLRARGSSDSAASYTSYSLPRAKRWPDEATAQQAGAAETYLPRVRFQLWQESLDAASAPAPKVGDLIVDAESVTWVVQQVTRKLMDNVFDCSCERRP